jgi:hypothetical protein
MSIHIRTTRRYIPEDGNIQNYCCEDLESYIMQINQQLCKARTDNSDEDTALHSSHDAVLRIWSCDAVP